MAKKISERELTEAQAGLSKVYSDLQDEILKQIINRLKTADLGKLNSDNVLEWQMKKLSELQMFNRDTIDYITQQVGRASMQLGELLNSIGEMALNDTDDKLQSVTGKAHQPTNHIDMMMKAFLGQTKRQLNNFVNQQLISDNFSNTAQAQAYTDIVNSTVAKVATGMHSPEQALAETVYKWQDRGLESGLIDRGGHRWTAQGYANTVIQSTIPRIYGEVVKQRMDDYDYHLVLYPVHTSSRPACAPLQGKVVNLLPKGAKGYDKRYPTVYDHGYGEAGGTLGINCSHWHYTVFDPDTMTNNLDPVDPKQAVKNYELTQQQRRLEAGIRQSKSKLKAAEALGDKKGINKFKSDIRIKQGSLRSLIDDHSEVLARDYRREKVIN